MPSPAQRRGILLNAPPPSSTTNLPDKTFYLSPFSSGAAVVETRQRPVSLLSFASSIISSAESTSDSSVDGRTQQRKIRFAPLPEPRHDYDNEDDLLSPQLSNESDREQTGHSPPVSTGDQPASPAPSPKLSEPHDQSSGSSLGISINDVDTPVKPSAPAAIVTAGSENGSDGSSITKRKAASWARFLHFPKSPSVTSVPHTSNGHAVRLNSRPSSIDESGALGRTLRAGELGARHSSSSSSYGNTKSASIDIPRTRQRPSSVVVSPSLSLRSGFPLKLMADDTGATSISPPYGTKRAGRRGTRLLNGRVYGTHRPGSAKDPFANIADEEPEFIEWGHGGMGSVRSAGVGSSQWAKLQSSKRVSIGHDDGTVVVDDEDDGSGMAWVKKRRAEREKKEREMREALEQRERKEGAGDGESISQLISEGVVPEASKTDLESSSKDVQGADLPSDTNEKKKLRDSQMTPEKHALKERERVYTTVTVPTPEPHRRRTRSRQASLETPAAPSPWHSAFFTPTLLTPTSETVPRIIVTGTPLGTPKLGSPKSELVLSPLALGAMETRENMDTPSSMASSRSSLEDDEDSEEEDEQMCKTVLGAGVEKVSRRKE